MNDETRIILIKATFGIIATFAVIGYIAWTFVPLLQGKQYLTKAKIAFEPAVIIDNKFIFEPWTNAQVVIRQLLLIDLIDKFHEKKLVRPDALFDHAIERVEEYTLDFPYHYELFVLLGKAYDAQATLKNDPELYLVAESYYKKALEVIPARQDVIFPYAINLLNQERVSEAEAILQGVVDDVPELPEGRYNLAQTLSVFGDDRYDDVLRHFEFALERNVNLNPSLTLLLYQKMFYHYYHSRDIERLDTTVLRLAKLDPAQEEQFLGVSRYIHDNGTIPPLNIIED